MKPFTLDAVLNYRQRLEDLAKQRFYKAQKVLQTIEDKLAEERVTLSQLIEKTANLQKDGIEITELIFYEERITYVRNNVLAIEKTVAEKRAIVNKEQQHLLEKSKERQIMDKLKEQQNKAWKEYLNKKEAAMLDEIAVIRHESEDN